MTAGLIERGPVLASRRGSRHGSTPLRGASALTGGSTQADWRLGPAEDTRVYSEEAPP
jgi:hypothetical protein